MSIHAKKSPHLDGVVITMSRISPGCSTLFTHLIPTAEARQLRDELSLAIADEPTVEACRECVRPLAACTCDRRKEGIA